MFGEGKPEELNAEAEETTAEVAAPAAPEKVEKKAEKKEAPVEAEKEVEVPPMDPRRAALPWFVVHTYSGFESHAKRSLEERIKQRGLIEKFGNVLVPQETVVEMVRGKKKSSTRKFFPGYILVQMELNDETWHVVKDTPKVTGFVGDSRDPLPLTAKEVETLVAQMEGGSTKPRPAANFETGDAVKVIDGPFAEFNGTIDEVKPDKGKLKVLISIFGRNTPVELDFFQVEKV